MAVFSNFLEMNLYPLAFISKSTFQEDGVEFLLLKRNAQMLVILALQGQRWDEGEFWASLDYISIL